MARRILFGCRWLHSRPCRAVELRSDTLTKPTEAMRRVMAQADVGDDVYNEDKTVHKLKAAVADLLGKEAGMFCASGTMGNLLSVAAHCRRGDEIILGNRNHVFLYEGGGASALLGVAYHTVPTLPDGTNSLDDIQTAIRIDDPHFPRTRMVCVETTHNKANGSPLPLSFLHAVGDLCVRRGLIMHIDGARLMNAAVALQTLPAELCRDAHSVSLCLSKGLGAPVGTVVVGTRDFIRETKRLRKMVGGGWRQAGILAAAGLYPLQNNVERLAEDHASAHALARGLNQVPGIQCDPSLYPSNIIYFSVKGLNATELVDRLHGQHNVLINKPHDGGNTLRAVTSLMVSREDVEYAVDAVRGIMSDSSSKG